MGERGRVGGGEDEPRWGGGGQHRASHSPRSELWTHKYCCEGAQRSAHRGCASARAEGLTWLPSTTLVSADSARTVPLSVAVTILRDVDEARLKRRESDVVEVGRRGEARASEREEREREEAQADGALGEPGGDLTPSRCKLFTASTLHAARPRTSASAEPTSSRRRAAQLEKVASKRRHQAAERAEDAARPRNTLLSCKNTNPHCPRPPRDDHDSANDPLLSPVLQAHALAVVDHGPPNHVEAIQRVNEAA